MPRGQTPKQRKFRKETKPLRKAIKSLSGVLGTAASARGVMSEKMKDLLKEAKKRKPSGRINTDDLKRIMEKTPMKKALGPVRPITERSQSKLKNITPKRNGRRF